MPALVTNKVQKQPFLRKHQEYEYETLFSYGIEFVADYAKKLMTSGDVGRSAYWNRLNAAISGWIRLTKSGHKLRTDYFIQSMSQIKTCCETVSACYLKNSLVQSGRTIEDTVAGLQEPLKSALSSVEGTRRFAQFKLNYYQRLKSYELASQTLGSIPAIKNVVENHFQWVQGKFMVNMADHKHFEYADPLHRNAIDGWDRHLQTEVDAGRDPFATLVDFLLRAEKPSAGMMNYDRSNPYVPAADRKYYQLINAYSKEVKGGKTLLTALYHCPTGKRGFRYAPNIDRVHSYGDVLSCRYLPYTSQGGSQTGGRRGIDDLIGGDLYVMNSNYDFFTFKPNNFHSYLLAGEAVMAAGILVAEQGKVLAIDSKSGHYQPTWKNLHQAVCELEFRGVMVADAIVGLMLPGENIMFFLKDDFIELGNVGFNFNATIKIIDKYYERYDGKLPVPLNRKGLIPPREAAWETLDGVDRWRSFLRVAFPKTMKIIDDAFKNLSTAIPMLDEWKKESDAGRFASRHETLRTIDACIQRYHEVYQYEKCQSLPDSRAILQAIATLKAAVRAWLDQKQEKTESTRRIAIMHLQEQIQFSLDYVGKLRPSSTEAMPMVGIQV